MKPSLYAQYYFELRSLFHDIKGDSSSAASSEWTYKPLSIIEARRLEDRSNNVWDKKKKSGGKSLSPVRSPQDNDQRASNLKSKSMSEKLSSITEKLPLLSAMNSSSISSPLSKGWQTSSPAQAHAHARQRMIGMHEESKGRNFNPYVFDARPRSLVRKSDTGPGLGTGTEIRTDTPPREGGDTGTNKTTSSQSVPTASGNCTPSATNPQGYDYTNGWMCLDALKSEDPVVRTFEDVTLTDTSRFVLS